MDRDEVTRTRVLGLGTDSSQRGGGTVFAARHGNSVTCALEFGLHVEGLPEVGVTFPETECVTVAVVDGPHVAVFTTPSTVTRVDVHFDRTSG